jgi:hypothetical protein
VRSLAASPVVDQWAQGWGPPPRPPRARQVRVGFGREALDLARERTDGGGRPTEPRGGERRRGGSLGFGGGGTARERRRCGAVGGSAGGAGGGEERWSSFRDPAGPLVGAGGRRGSACGSADRTPRGQNHGVERYPYAFLGVEIIQEKKV